MIFDIEKLKQTEVSKWHNLIIIPLNNNLNKRRATSRYGSSYKVVKNPNTPGLVYYNKSIMEFTVSISGKDVISLDISSWFSSRTDELLEEFLNELQSIVMKDKIEMMEL